MSRKLATIRTISELRPIPGADAIECAVVDGWTVVVKKGEYRAGAAAIYCEIDSWIPHTVAPFLSKGQEPREYEGVKGERLRTIKLRGQLSQGLLLPVDLTFWRDPGTDVTDSLGIKKWEAPIPAQLSGQVRGSFPSYIPKTDQERIQNLVTELGEWRDKGHTWEVTEKLDGTSMTVFLDHEGRFGVCGRNWELTETAENSLWRSARAVNLETNLRSNQRALAVQGELIGEGIQGNPYKLKGQSFWVYEIYYINKGQYLSSEERRALVDSWGQDGLAHVPVIGTAGFDDDFVFGEGVDGLLSFAEGKSRLCETTEQEGFVFKCIEDPAVSFKAISNKFLLKSA